MSETVCITVEVTNTGDARITALLLVMKALDSVTIEKAINILKYCLAEKEKENG